MGRPVRDDRHLFEMLTLEGAQAGLSWSTILRKRDGYRKAFANFDAAKVARFTQKMSSGCSDPGIVRNRLKVESTVNNAQRVVELDESAERLPVELRRRRAAREQVARSSPRSRPRPQSRRR